MLYEFWYYPGDNIAGKNFRIIKSVRGKRPGEASMLNLVGPFSEMRLLKKDFLQRLQKVRGELDRTMDLISLTTTNDI